jgi:hypothetical protein
MSKEEVLAEFEIDIKEYENEKMAGLFDQSIKSRTKRIIVSDRSGVVEALRYWLCRRDSLTVTALIVIADVNIPELKLDLECLKKDIESGKIFLPYYNSWVDRALKTINNNPRPE